MFSNVTNNKINQEIDCGMKQPNTNSLQYLKASCHRCSPCEVFR